MLNDFIKNLKVKTQNTYFMNKIYTKFCLSEMIG